VPAEALTVLQSASGYCCCHCDHLLLVHEDAPRFLEHGRQGAVGVTTAQPVFHHASLDGIGPGQSQQGRNFIQGSRLAVRQRLAKQSVVDLEDVDGISASKNGDGHRVVKRDLGRVQVALVYVEEAGVDGRHAAFDRGDGRQAVQDQRRLAPARAPVAG